MIVSGQDALQGADRPQLVPVEAAVQGPRPLMPRVLCHNRETVTIVSTAFSRSTWNSCADRCSRTSVSPPLSSACTECCHAYCALPCNAEDHPQLWTLVDPQPVKRPRPHCVPVDEARSVLQAAEQCRNAARWKGEVAVG